MSYPGGPRHSNACPYLGCPWPRRSLRSLLLCHCHRPTYWLECSTSRKLISSYRGILHCSGWSFARRQCRIQPNCSALSYSRFLGWWTELWFCAHDSWRRWSPGSTIYRSQGIAEILALSCHGWPESSLDCCLRTWDLWSSRWHQERSWRRYSCRRTPSSLLVHWGWEEWDFLWLQQSLLQWQPPGSRCRSSR